MMTTQSTNDTMMANEPHLPDMVTCQRDGCPQRHRTRFHMGYGDFDELSGERTIGNPGVVQLRRCSRCKQVHYCSVDCQRIDWRRRHRIECNNFGRTPPPNVDIESADENALRDLLMFIFQSCITRGEERAWTPENVEKAKRVGRRLYAIGGKDLCASVCDDLCRYFSYDPALMGDARMLEYVWSDPVIPGWWP